MKRINEHDAAVCIALGARIRARRSTLGMSQEKLGEAVGITFQQVQKYERGLNRVSVPMLLRLSIALSTSVGDLLDGVGIGTVGATPTRAQLEIGRAVARLPAHHQSAILNIAKSLVDVSEGISQVRARLATSMPLAAE